MTEREAAPAVVDTHVAHSARRYNYWLGGKDNFQADRDSADEIEASFPGVRQAVRANREVLGRMTRYLARDAGVRQFLDIGTGLPTADNTHEVAQRVNPAARVLYVDNDPLVMTHARALLTSTPEGMTNYIEADLRRPQDILSSPELLDTLDLSQPVALMLIAILHFLPDREQERAVVGRLMDALPSGSYLAATHATFDFMSERGKAVATEMLTTGRADTWPSTRDEFARLFDGLDLVEPGIALLTEWRPDERTSEYDPARVNMWAAVARKP
ncbi:SAM-dependent methyltransferase [Actinoplanes sp. NPDC051411]|uniref:SAM-dependent methyltransferase n=1 Tax=Actinoplanes sp. NPDC051411 TaxID=3155522 RepID=UPI003445F4A5